MQEPPLTIDAYISSFSEEVQAILQQIRLKIREVVPDAKETISYGMPTFTYYGVLIHFAAHKNHIGIYPTPAAIENFKAQLSSYKTSKGAIQFPKKEPIPFHLLTKIVQWREKENKNKILQKKIEV